MSLKTTPFKVVYGHDSPRHLSYVPRSSQVEAIDQALVERDTVLTEALHRAQQAQARMKEYYDKGHRHIAFNPSTFVWLKLHPYTFP